MLVADLSGDVVIRALTMLALLAEMLELMSDRRPFLSSADTRRRHRVRVVLVHLPRDRHLPLLVVRADVRALFHMDGEPSSPGYETHDLIPGDGVTALREFDEQPVDALDLDGIVLAFRYRADHLLDPAHLRGLGDDLPQYLQRRVQAVPDAA